MKTFVKISLVLVAVVGLCATTAEAAPPRVKVHLDTTGLDPPMTSGYLKIYATHNCEIIHPPLFSGKIEHCVPVVKDIPDKWYGKDVNDIMIRFGWHWWCDNRDHTKAANPRYYEGTWVLDNIGDWIEDNVTEPLEVPSIGDSTGVDPDIYSVADLGEWAADPRPLLPEYVFVNGECPDLPGYLVGTTPIIFNPDAGEEENPFSTVNPYNGTLHRTMTITYGTPDDITPIPAISEWGMVVLGLFLLTGVTIAYYRRRRAAA